MAIGKLDGNASMQDVVSKVASIEVELKALHVLVRAKLTSKGVTSSEKDTLTMLINKIDSIKQNAFFS